MSDLGRREHFARANTQLPVHAYFDEALFKREIETLFSGGPGYVGHHLMVPEPGDYHALHMEREGRVLVRSQQGIELLSNVCRHRQAIMLRGRGNTANIVCPLHRWTYDLQGQLLGAPHFAEQPCVRLESTPPRSTRLLSPSPAPPLPDLPDRRSSPSQNSGKSDPAHSVPDSGSTLTLLSPSRATPKPQPTTTSLAWICLTRSSMSTSPRLAAHRAPTPPPTPACSPPSAS